MPYVCHNCGCIVTQPTHTIEDCNRWIKMLVNEEVRRNRDGLKSAEDAKEENNG